MGFRVCKTEQYTDGAFLEVTWHFDMYIATIAKTKADGVDIEYIWKYESESLQSVMKWVNKVRAEPLECRFFESGTFTLPHNKGFGNSTPGERVTLEEGIITS
jgi:hypothetical protein